MKQLLKSIWEHPRLRRYTSLVQDDLASTYSRDLHKWLLIAPILGVLTGLLITAVIQIIVKWLWPAVLHQILAHPLAMVPTVTVGFLAAGLIMQYWTPDPNEHSTEEIIHAYHEHQGAVELRPFVPKLLAAIATVGFGGSAALEGPSIYGGGSIGSWLWTRMRRLGLDSRDRRIMLISGAAAGMSAVFRAPLTGIIFALEMPYKDDLAHEALMPSLIASVVSYATMATFLGSTPLFDFGGGTTYTRQDLLWSAVLGAACGLVAMTFDITFRRFRGLCVRSTIPHWVKMTAGGILTGCCGLAFLSMYPGRLVPLGPNYEAVSLVLQQSHGSVQLVVFGVFKLLATLFSLGVGGVSAMFVPLFLTGSSFGVAFGQSVVHSVSPDLYAAVGTAAFIAAGYKAPLTAVVFVAEATGGHAFIIPALIGAAIAYGVSGEASVSGDQRLHEGVRVEDLANVPVSHAMQRDVRTIEAERSLGEFAELVATAKTHTLYPVLDSGRPIGTIAVNALNGVLRDQWAGVQVRKLMEREVERVAPEADLQEALRILLSSARPHMLLVVSDQALVGVVTKSDILTALGSHSGGPRGTHVPGEWR